MKIKCQLKNGFGITVVVKKTFRFPNVFLTTTSATIPYSGTLLQKAAENVLT
jgi:hypothetical protein